MDADEEDEEQGGMVISETLFYTICTHALRGGDLEHTFESTA
jgi:hypothetical protein